MSSTLGFVETRAMGEQHIWEASRVFFLGFWFFLGLLGGYFDEISMAHHGFFFSAKGLGCTYRYTYPLSRMSKSLRTRGHEKTARSELLVFSILRTSTAAEMPGNESS